GTIVQCTYLIDDEQRDVPLYLAERPENPGYAVFASDLINTSFVPIYGMELVPSSTLSRRQYMVQRILTGSIADEAGFSVNDPVAVMRVRFSDDKDVMYTELSTRRSKKGFLDIVIGLPAQLNSPHYF
ncbi:MAG: peptidase S1, partial [Treponema sp.]|nr:peptidase S1 [Treponema sp.]